MREFMNIVEGVGEARVYHVTTKRAASRIMRDGLQPKTGPRARSARERAPAIYVFPDWLSLEDGLTNWLSDQFDETTPLSVLELKVPRDWLVQDEVRWEARILQAVPPERIRVIIPDLDNHDGKAPPDAVWPENP